MTLTLFFSSEKQYKNHYFLEKHEALEGKCLRASERRGPVKRKRKRKRGKLGAAQTMRKRVVNPSQSTQDIALSEELTRFAQEQEPEKLIVTEAVSIPSFDNCAGDPENAEAQANAPVKPEFNNIRDMFDDEDDVVEISDDDDQISVKDNLGSYVDKK